MINCTGLTTHFVTVLARNRNVLKFCSLGQTHFSLIIFLHFTVSNLFLRLYNFFNAELKI